MEQNVTPSAAKAAIGFTVSGGILLLALTFGSILRTAWGPLPAWLVTAAALTVGAVLFAALVPPTVLARRPRLVMVLAFVQVAVIVVGGILLRRQLGLGTHSASDWVVFLLAVAAAHGAAKALARSGVTDRLRRVQRA